jgi:L-ascorbate metabolism protein UlaG (beta-lactamase superfamily)
MAITLTWYSHSCWRIDTPNGILLTDPYLSDNPAAAIKPDQVQANYILVSHGHFDHWGDTVDIAKRTGAEVISNFEITNYCKELGIEKTHEMHIGGSKEFPFGRVKLTVAHHGSSFPGGRYAGSACGFLLTIGNKKIYDVGDTALFSDMKLIGDEGIDVAMMPIGDNYTMGPEDALKAAKFIRPKVLFPMHYNTFDLIAQDPAAFAKRVVRVLPKTKVVVLKPGESYELSDQRRVSRGT